MMKPVEYDKKLSSRIFKNVPGKTSKNEKFQKFFGLKSIGNRRWDNGIKMFKLFTSINLNGMSSCNKIIPSKELIWLTTI